MHSKNNSKQQRPLVLKQLTNQFVLICLVLLPALLPNMALALEFRSVSVAKAVLFDAPSAQAKKVFLLGQGYPVEIIVNLGDWLKVRDNQGGLSWIEAKNTTPKRTVLVRVEKADIKQTANDAAKVLGSVDKDVVLELVTHDKTGWVQVRHRDGLTGYIQSSEVWGL